MDLISFIGKDSMGRRFYFIPYSKASSITAIAIATAAVRYYIRFPCDHVLSAWQTINHLSHFWHLTSFIPWSPFIFISVVGCSCFQMNLCFFFLKISSPTFPKDQQIIETVCTVCMMFQVNTKNLSRFSLHSHSKIREIIYWFLMREMVHLSCLAAGIQHHEKSIQHNRHQYFMFFFHTLTGFSVSSIFQCPNRFWQNIRNEPPRLLNNCNHTTKITT